MIKFIMVFLALFVMMASQVYAQPMNYGLGVQTCARYIKVLDGYRKGNYSDSADYFAFISWFQGFASDQSHRSGEDVLHGKDSDAIALWLENYCREHSFDKFYMASEKLLTTLKNK